MNGSYNMKTAKESLIEYITSLPDDIDIFRTAEGHYNDVDIKIFIEPKTEEFYQFYFGP